MIGRLLCRLGFHLQGHHEMGGSVYSACIRSCGWSKVHR